MRWVVWGVGWLLWAQDAVWPGRILFELREGFSAERLPPELVELRDRVGGQVRLRFPQLPLKNPTSRPIWLLEYTADLHPTYVAKLWRRSPAVLYAEPEYLPAPFASPTQILYLPSDTLDNPYLRHLRVLGAWDSTHGDTSVVIAIVDTDVKFDHLDLVDNIAYNWNDPINGLDDDGDGYVDNFQGWDLVGSSYSGSGSFTPDNDPRVLPYSGHGTWMAGFAGATTDNITGVAAAGFKCRILPVKVAPDNQPLLYAAYDGILYAAQHGAQVVNCSWGGTFYSQAAQNFIRQVVQTYDPLLVAAAGNIPPDTPATFYPANYDGVLAVTAVDTHDVWWGTVQIGYGIDIATTGAGTTVHSNNGTDHSYFKMGATTSGASAIASGCAALLRSWRPDLNAYQIAELLRITADSVEPQNLPHLRYRLGRRLNLARAVATRDTPACRVTAWQAYDTNDSLFFAGETFFLSATYTNYLSPVSNLTVSIEPLTPHLQITSPPYAVGNLGTLQSHGQTIPFSLTVQPSCPFNAKLPVLFRFQGDGGYSDYQVIELPGLNPAYVHLDSAQLRTTLCGNGRVGYYDPPTNRQGRGARWAGSSESWLFEGGLFIIDDTSAHLSTRAPLGGMYNHFAPTQAATHRTQGLYEIGEVPFLVSGGLSAPKPFTIQAQAYALRREPANPFVAFLYRLENYSSTDSYADLSVGWWLDFDVGNNPATDRAALHPTLPMVYAYNSSSSRFMGAVLLSSHILQRRLGRIDTFSASPPSYIHLARQPGAVSSTTGDIFVVIAAKGVNLPAGGSDTVALALVGGYTLSELEMNAEAALTWYACFVQGNEPLVDLGPDRTLCQGDSLIAPPGLSSYTWSSGQATPVVYPTQSGLYWLLVQDAQGCWGYDEVFLTVNALSAPQVAFSPGLTVSVGETFTATEQSGAPYQYQWKVQTPTGWQTYTGSSFTHTFSAVGSYTVWLYRRDPSTGCTDSLSWEVTVTTTSHLLGSEAFPALYPNPTKEGFVLWWRGAVRGPFRLLSLTGQLLWEAPLEPPGSWYALPPNLPAGTYLWEVGPYRGKLAILP